MTPVPSANAAVGTRLAATCELIFGPDWAAGLSRVTQVNIRTCQRLKASIERGEEDPRAATLSAELTRRLTGILSDGTDQAVAKGLTWDNSDVGRYINHLAHIVDWTDRGRLLGPYTQEAMEVIFSEAAGMEEYLMLLTHAAAAISANRPTPEDWDSFYFRLDDAAEALGAIYGFNFQTKRMDLLKPPERIFGVTSGLWPQTDIVWLVYAPLRGSEADLESLRLRLDQAGGAPECVELGFYNAIAVLLKDEEEIDFHVVAKVKPGGSMTQASKWLSSVGLMPEKVPVNVSRTVYIRPDGQIIPR